MASFGDVFGEGSVAYQMFVWGILNQVLQNLASPGFTELAATVNSAAPVQPLSAADAATAANRSFLDVATATAEAARNGISSTRFETLRQLAGNAPAPEELAIALRRGVIPADGSGPDATSFVQGIAEGNLLDKWGPVIEAIAKQVPSPADIVDAIVRNQVTAADGEQLYAKVGGDTDYLQLLVDVNGRPPAPTQLIELAQRGIIPWDGTGPDATTYQQGIFEGDTKDKWEPVIRHLAEYYPTASEALELYRWGQFDQDQVTQLLTQRGLDQAEITAWIGYADANAINDYRGLTEQSVLAMLSISYITDDQATVMLKALHRGPDAIKQLIEYAHIQRAIQAVNAGIGRIGSLYQGRKITQSTATTALHQLGVLPTAIPDIIADWEAIAGANVKTLTESQIADAMEYGIMDQATALQELVNIGYTPYDAWVVLSIKAKQKLPGQPDQGPGAALGPVTPGTT